MLDWATTDPGRLPAITPLESIFRTPRPPPLPAHCFAMDAAGEERCVRCLLPPSLACGRPCRPHGSLQHRLYRLGKGMFCGRCGAFSFEQVVLLGGACKGRPTSSGSEWRLKRLFRGHNPKTNESIGTPFLVDPALASFAIVLGEGPVTSADAVQVVPGTAASV